MKKKLFTAALALSCAALCAAGFAACDKGGDNIDKDTDVNLISSETVTEAQWKAALSAESFANVKLFSNEQNSQTENGNTETETETTETYVDGAKLYMKQTREGTTTESYFTTIENVHYQYIMENGVWKREKRTYDMIEDIKQTFTEYADLYSKFEFNEEKNGYYYFYEDQGDSSATFKFKDGKVCGLVLTFGETYEGVVYSSSMTLGVYDYGKASVTLPAVSDDGDDGEEPSLPTIGNTVTEAQWKAALSESAFANVTCSASTFTPSLTEPSKVVCMFDSEMNRFKVSGDVYSGTSDGEKEKHTFQQVSAKLDNEFYLFTKADESDWQCSKITEANYQNDLQEISISCFFFKGVKDNMSDFTYDAQTRMYSAENIALDGIGTAKLLELKFESGKLISVYAEFDDSLMKMSMRLTFSDYGTTMIAIPADYTDAE